VEWQVRVEAHHAKATPSLGKVARHVKGDTFAVMRLFPNGTAITLSGTGEALTFASRNCTKHNCRCDYMDQPPATEESSRSPRTPDLQMTAGIERELDLWRMTGEPPFPELRMTSKSYWHRFSSIDLRLIHHISGLSIDMHHRGYSGCTVWAQKMPACVAVPHQAFVDWLKFSAGFSPLLYRVTLY
jgi:hypothetical protein